MAQDFKPGQVVPQSGIYSISLPESRRGRNLQSSDREQQS
jgi:hypothetical protein